MRHRPILGPLLSGMPQPSLTVLVVGCGNIAGRFDDRRSISDWPFTHAGAYRRDGRFAVTACVDPDVGRRNAFMVRWCVPHGYASLVEAAASGKHWDVISICSPTPCHAEDVEMAIRLAPRLIFCEKPVTDSAAKSERLIEHCAKAGIFLAVNHNRRWDPHIDHLYVEMQSGKWGALRSVVGIYNKGVLNNGTHMLDLLNRLLGPLAIVSVGKLVHDYFAEDPSVPVCLSSSDGVPVQLVCGHASDYAIFELQLIFEAGMVSIEDGGKAWRERHPEASGDFLGYRFLDAGTCRIGGDERCMVRAVDNIHRTVVFGDALSSTGDTALAAQLLGDRIRALAMEQST